MPHCPFINSECKGADCMFGYFENHKSNCRIADGLNNLYELKRVNFKLEDIKTELKK